MCDGGHALVCSRGQEPRRTVVAHLRFWLAKHGCTVIEHTDGHASTAGARRWPTLAWRGSSSVAHACQVREGECIHKCRLNKHHVPAQLS
uniref:Uncharacterized protein n=1 Tax=Triticum urartu TaxID=4572 RepID=A0A8R7PED3_TRIUA